MSHERALILLFALSTCALGIVLVREVRRRGREDDSGETLLFPFSNSTFSEAALSRSISIARGTGATLLPAYLAVVSLRVPLEAPLPRHADRAVPMLDRIEEAAARRGVRVDASIESGRTLRHALSRTIAARRPDQVVIAAAVCGREGFDSEDIAWILDRVRCGVVVLKPISEI